MGLPKTVGVSLMVVFLAGTLATDETAQGAGIELAGQFEPKGIWQLRIELSDAEFAALEPAVPQPPGFGGPAPPVRQAVPQPDRESVANMFGMQFPWVRGTVNIEAATDSAGQESSDSATRALDCRVRYDGDFTYFMAATSPKRPMYVELLNGATMQGSKSIRLHTMQIDPTLMRERVAAHVFAALKVPVPRVIHAEVRLAVGDKEPQSLGLYTILETVDPMFLKRAEIPETSLIMQLNGLNSIQYLGDEWNAYGPSFRLNRPASKQEQDRIIAFAKLIAEANDEEFNSKISEFIETDALLRYVAANALTSNVTGFATLGQNDYLCLDSATGKFIVVACELETALGGAVLSGTPEQLADLSVQHPYAGECKLVDRLMKSTTYGDAYLAIVHDAVKTACSIESLNTVISQLAQSSAESRTRETQAAAIRAQQAGGGIGPSGFGNAQAMDAQTFVLKRAESVTRQLAGGDRGYVPSPPNFGGGISGPPRGGSDAPVTDTQFRESVQVPESFDATLFAKAPDVNYPVAISAEPFGAIYVASDEQGSLGTEKGGGKILRCVDENDDGVMDRVTTFARVEHPRGVVYRGGSVWVCHPPFLSVFHDDDDDGVADRNKQLVSGLTTELVDTRGGDHTANGIRLGVDGWLYIGDGDYGVANAVGIDGSTVTLRGGGILRVRPEGTELEVFCSGLRNPFDIAIDPQLNMFTRDNTNDGGGWDTRVSQLFQSAEYGYPRLFANFSDEIMPALGAFGGGGGTASLYIEDDAWPSPYNRSLFTGDWGRSAVFHHPLSAAGPTFHLTQESFASIPRATGMDLDANGNLYVASWWSGEASVYVGPQVGFITRVAPKGAKSRRFPSLAEASLAELIELLRSPQAVVRFHAQGEMLKRADDPSAANELSRLASDRQFPLHGRIAALFAFKQLAGIKSHPLLVSLTKDEDLREFAIRALTDRNTELDGLNAEMFADFLDDDSPRVKAQALIALGRLGDAAVADQVVPLVDTENDDRPNPAEPNPSQVIPHLALRTLIKMNAVDSCLKTLDGPHWQGALRALRYMHNREAVEGLISRLAIERDTDRRDEILITLVRLYQYETTYDGSWWGIRPDTTGPFYDPTTWDMSDRIASVLLTAISESDVETVSALRTELQRHQVSLPGLATEPETIVAEQHHPIVIDPVDPSNPNQIGNMQFADALQKTLAASGSSEAGAVIFKTRSCNACHTSAAGQKPIGPHLADIGKRYKAYELAESILKPSEKIAQGYETQMILLASGKIRQGFVISENGRQISLRDSSGETHRIPRDEIDERSRQQVSAMPEGLTSSLEPKQLADLVAYLQSL